MQDVGKLYEEYSIPLKEANEFKEGELYIDIEGNSWKCVSNQEFLFIHGSPLVCTELVIGLTPKQLDLFWRIHKNKINMKKVS